jgi:hypothetical protein
MQTTGKMVHKIDKMIDQAFSDLKEKCGGVRNDYFGLIYLEQEYNVPREEAINYVSFGGNDYGIDGFFFDRERKNFYLFQFKYTDSYTQFKASFQRLIDSGMERVFGAQVQDSNQNDMLLQLRCCLLENQKVIDKVYVHFVFLGDPEEAERSQVLDKLREDLENKKHLVDKYFGRPMTLVIEFRSAETHKIGSVSHQRTTRTYSIDIPDTLEGEGPRGERMIIGFVKLKDLYTMYHDMGVRFFERNIRSALPQTSPVNRALMRAYRRIILDNADDPSVFVFNHNGITLVSEKVDKLDSKYRITEPRLLNGAQTITTFASFFNSNQDIFSLKERDLLIDQIRVMCKIITEADPEFITEVTINNNRQNPVEPWNLRANDMIQLELQDKFRDDLGVYYERQEQAFESLSDEELEDIGIIEKKPIELLRLAQTFLVADGEIDKTSSMRRVFEDDRIYNQVFNKSRLTADSRKIVLCYKIQFRLRRIMNIIYEKGPSKYGYMNRARHLLWALLCQGILNDPQIEGIAEEYGKDMTMPADFTDYLCRLATARCRFVFADLANYKDNADKIAEGKFSFLKTNASYKACMDFAYKRWKWVEKGLK